MAKKVTMITEVAFDKCYELSGWYDDRIMLVEVDGQEDIMVVRNRDFYYKVEDIQDVVRIMKLVQASYYIKEYEQELEKLKQKVVKTSKTIYLVDDYRTVQQIHREREEAEEAAKAQAEEQEEVVA